METLQSGWLIKSPPERRPWNILKQNWKKRYFVLCQLFTSTHKSDRLQLALEYYDSESKCCKKGKIDLENCDDIQSGLRCPPHDYVFSMRTKHRGQSRIYYLAAESFEEMDRWVQSLCTVLSHGRPSSQHLRQVPAIYGYDFSTYNERTRRPDIFSGRRSSFHCSRASCRPSVTREHIRNNSSDVGLSANDTQSSFLDSIGSFNFTASQQSSDCYIPLGECYSGLRKEKQRTASDDDFLSSGRYGSFRKRDRNDTLGRNIKHSRESRSYSNLTGDCYKTMPNFRHPQNSQIFGSRPAVSGRQRMLPPPRATTSNRLAVPSRANTTRTVFLNNSFASSRPFLEPDRSLYINSKWERNFKTVPLHPHQSFDLHKNSRWYTKSMRNEVQLPMKSYNRSFESGSSCDEGDDESSPSTFNEYPSYLNNSRAQHSNYHHHPHQRPHHVSLHYLDLDLDSCHLDDEDVKSTEKDRGRSGSRSARDVTQYCQIDFCKTKGLQDTRIDVESERKNSDRSVENNAPVFSVF